MANKTLEQLYAEHSGKVSDKWSIYLAEYDRIFAEYRNRPVRLLEIGIQNGGSLEIWSKYFMNAQKLVGCDINPDCVHLTYEDQRIAVVVGDANNDLTRAKVLGHSPAFDIVIDDGSHYSSDIVKSFAKYFPHIAEGGVFIAEDLHCSYWQEFEGGLFDPSSSIAFFKRLADIANYEHWGVEKHRISILSTFFSKYGFQIDEEILQHIHSVEFVNSLCIVRKNKPQYNQLGKRFIAGSVEEVMQGILELSSKEAVTLNQRRNGWAARALAPEEELPLLIKELAERKTELAERDSQIASLNQSVAELTQSLTERDGQIAALYNSTSWRVMAPMRIVGRQLKRVRRVAELAFPAIKRGGGFKNTTKKAIELYRSEGFSGIKRGFRIAATAGMIKPTRESGEYDRNDYAEWIRRYDTLTDQSRATIRTRIDSFSYKPLISVVMPTYNPKREWLIEAIESVRNQIYPHWELCIADDASTDQAIAGILEGYVKNDSRIKVVFRQENGHISAASNSALELATGEWVALLDHDDLLAEHALFWVANTINQAPDVRMIYSDEDKIDAKGVRLNPYFKCDWNKDLFYSQNMFNHLGVYSASLIRQVGGFRVGFEGSQDYDLIIRCIENIKEHQICHIPRVLYHWRVHSESVAQSGNAKPYAVTAAERALNEHFVRRGIAATAKFEKIGYRIHYELPSNPPLVTLIIPTRNGLQLIRQCINSVLEKTTYPNYEILIVDNGSDDRKTLDYFESLKSNPQVRILHDDRPFNYSALNNAAVEAARGELIALINNDIEVISPNWLSEMVSHALREEIGAVGARLWYPNDTLQHGGVVLGLGGVAGHSHKHLCHGQNGYFGRAVLTQRFSAVTGACLLIRKAIFEKVGGLNETDLQIAFNDVDFCLRVREAGYYNLWTPFAELYHHESASRGFEDTPEKQLRFLREVTYMKQQWGAQIANDPAYSPNLTQDHEDFSFAWPPRRESSFNNMSAPLVVSSRMDKALAMVNREGLGLEIGPSHNPIAPKKRGFNVHILDHASAAELRMKYKDHGVNLENIEEVDFVWQGEPLHHLIGQEECYDWIVASHVIEHTPDLVTFLLECERLLKPNGVLSLIIPDKRYCFDYFNPATSTGEILDAFEQKRTRPSPGKVFDHFSKAAKLNNQIAWSAHVTGKIDFVHQFSEAQSQWLQARSTEEYIDVHNWRFTPASFRSLLSDLQALGLTTFEINLSFDTEGCEFYVTLGKTTKLLQPTNRLLFAKQMLDDMKC